jgi:hypothetical protein
MGKHCVNLSAEYFCHEAEINGKSYERQEAVEQLKSSTGFKKQVDNIAKCLVWDLDTDKIDDLRLIKVTASWSDYGDVINAEISFSFNTDIDLSAIDGDIYEDLIYDLANGFLFRMKSRNSYATFLIDEGYSIEVV